MPFPGKERAPDIGISGSLGRRSDELFFRCALRGDLSELAIPPQDAFPRREDRLWEETCLELFLGAKGSERYWEFNLSPAGHWNAYRFASYREGMRRERAFTALPFRVRRVPGILSLSLTLCIGGIVPGARALEAAACAVVKTVTGEKSHWALAHPGPRPDFHRREGFELCVPAE